MRKNGCLKSSWQDCLNYSGEHHAMIGWWSFSTPIKTKERPFMQGQAKKYSNKQAFNCICVQNLQERFEKIEKTI